MKTKSVFTLIVVVTLAALLAACGAPAPTPAPTSAPAATTAPAQAAAPTKAAAAPTAAPVAKQPSGVVLYGTGDVTYQRNFNPFNASPRQPTQNGIYEPLMIYNTAQGKLMPWLAAAYEWSADNKTLTFTLRDGVKWSDGQAFTAKDVVYTFTLLKTTSGLISPALSAVSGANAYVDTITAPDDRTVKFAFKTVFTPGLYDIIQQNIVPEHIWKDVTDPIKFTNDNPVGTGPFTQVTTFEAQVFQVDRNPNYWQAGKPAIQALRFKAYGGNDPQNMAMANGELDWLSTFFPDVKTTLVAKNPTNFGYWYSTFGRETILILNTTKAPFDNADVRKAISMAINRDQLVTVAMSDYTKPADVTGLSDGYAQFKVSNPASLGDWTTLNVNKANQLLDAAGLARGADGIRKQADGTPLKYDIIAVNGWTDWVSGAQIMAENLKVVGINASVATVDFPVWVDRRNKGNFDMLMGFEAISLATPYAVYRDAMTSLTTAAIGTAAAGNYGRFVSKEGEDLLKQFAATGDVAQQKQIAEKLQKVFADTAPVIPLYPQPSWFEYNSTRFVGWPTKDNPYATPAILPSYSNPEALVVMTTITPK